MGPTDVIAAQMFGQGLSCAHEYSCQLRLVVISTVVKGVPIASLQSSAVNTRPSLSLHSAPSCEPQVVDNAHPPVKKTVGSAIYYTYHCYEGYSILNSSTLSCYKGNLLGETPECTSEFAGAKYRIVCSLQVQFAVHVIPPNC